MHRDIKPENLIFDENGYLYLTDMGIAKLYIPKKSIIDGSGTPGYMAPEVINNSNHDMTCDFYAIGVLVYELMFLSVFLNPKFQRPFNGKNRNEIRDQMLAKEINIIASDVPKNWSLEAADFITKVNL